MPASLRSWNQMSLGHFKRKSGCKLCATETPATNDSPDQSEGDRGTPREKAREARGDAFVASLCHWRPRRPRPAVCRSATSKAGSSCPTRARRISSVLVESIWGSTSTVKPGNAGSTASQIASDGHRMGVITLAEGPLPRTGQRPRLGASRVPRQVLAPHQQGYSALSLGV